MLDVHPPAHPAHTWKDFFIHIATITIGLLIAVGLEQTVEAFHHHRQARELEQQLQEEAQVNSRRISLSFTTSDAEVAWLVGLQQDVRAMLARRAKFDYRSRPESEPGVPIAWVTPRTGVWDAARQSGIVSLLSAARAEQYAEDYRQADIADTNRMLFYQALSHQQAFEMKFATAQCPATPDLTRMNPQQMETYSTLIGETYAAALEAKNRLRAREYTNQFVLTEMTRQQAAAARSAAMLSHPNRFPSLAPGTPYTGTPAPPQCR